MCAEECKRSADGYFTGYFTGYFSSEKKNTAAPKRTEHRGTEKNRPSGHQKEQTIRTPKGIEIWRSNPLFYLFFNRLNCRNIISLLTMKTLASTPTNTLK
jgi:predicted nucleotide-binding protein (sugar kinase/HSP70/actin superfamily)